MNQPLQQAQQWLPEQGLQAYLHLHTDPHQSEYLADHWQGLPWLSGFTGSAGSLVITPSQAALWTDSRYFLQAETELAGKDIALMKAGLPETSSRTDWLQAHLPPQAKVGYDPALISVHAQLELERELTHSNLQAVPAPGLLEAVWTERPALPKAAVLPHASTLAGATREQKAETIRQQMRERQADGLLITTLDDLAWLTNLRGSDIAFNPVFVAYCVLELEQVHLFVAEEKISAALAGQLQSAGYQLHRYEALPDWLSRRPAGYRLWLDPDRCNAHLHQQLPVGVRTITKTLPTTLAKSCKNATEQEHLRACHRKDGVAMVRFLAWLEREVGLGELTELGAAQQLLRFRAEQPAFVGPSFPSISGYGPHGAIVHFRVSEATALPLQPEGLYLIDSGGQYQDGTTDITRTVALGPLTEQMKRDYTRVLQGMIALSRARFPAGTQGVQLDVLARQFLWEDGMNYGHGTGHGVGFYLNVHEGPVGISPKVRPQPPLAEGMVLSNEPGLYRDGAYGIRIENLVLVSAGETGPFGTFHRFDTLTLCPIDKRPIDRALLRPEEKIWLDQYHQRVWEALSPLLDGDDKAWLAQATEAL